MRIIKTFILRLYTDLELPDQFCGSLQSLTERKTISFKNSAELLDLLHHLANEKAKALSLNVSQGDD